MFDFAIERSSKARITMIFREKNMKTLVPFDGSLAATRALKLAIEQAKSLPTHSIVVLNVQNLATQDLPEGVGIMSPEWIREQEEQVGSQILAEPRSLFEKAGVPFEARVELGGIATTIERVARECDADHIIMGTRGLGGVRGLLLGSVATKVLKLVDVPVTLVK